MKQSTTFAQVANNQFDYLSSALCANTPPCKKHSSSRKFLTSSISLRLLLVMFLTLTVSTNAWAQTKTDIMFAKGFGSYTTNSFSAAGTDKTAVANSTNATSVKYAMQVFNGNTGAVRGNQSSAASNFSCRNTTTFDGYYISQVSLTVSGGTIDGSTNGRSVVYFGTTAYGNPNTTTPSGTATKASPASSGQATLTWTNTNEDVSYFILYNLKTSGTALSANATNSLKVVWTKKTASAPSFTITATSNNNNYGTVSVSGTTITASPKTGYTYANPAYTVTAGTATVTQNGNTFTVTPSSDCSIQINFAEKVKNTYIDNVQGNSTQTLYDTHAAPSLTDKAQATTGTCEQQHWHFMGWVTEANKENPTDANIVKANTSVTANGTTYYAVWAKGTTTGGGSTSKQYSFDITPSNFNSTSYAANNNEKTSTAKASDGSTLSVKWTSNQVMLQSGDMQWQKSAGYIYNSTDLGTINSVTITKSAGTFTTYYGTSKQPSSSTTVGNGYFQIKVGDATGKTSKVTITFTKTTQGAQTTTYSDYITSCTTETSISLYPNFDSKLPTVTTTGATTYTVPPCTLSRTGYTFSHWDTKADGTGADYYPNDEITLDGTDVNLYAIWTLITYTITYELDGGTNHASNPANYTIETEAITLQDPSKTGYTFGGWYKESTFATQVTQIAEGSTGNITLYAKWEVAVITYTITCSVNEETTSKTYEQGATIEFPAVTPCDGMVHVGWTETERYASETTAPSDLLTAATAIKTTTYYAVFAKLVEDSNAPYQLVEADRADWSGKYLIAYNNQTFADGRIGGKTADGSIGKTGHNIDMSSYIDGNNIPSENGDPYHVNLVSCEGGGYLLQTQDGKYNYYSKNTDNGLNANTDRKVAEPYKLNIVFKKSNDIQLALSGNAKGSVFHHNPSNKIFQFYKDASMSPVYLYRQNEVYTDYSTRCKYTVTFDANGLGEAPEGQIVYKNEFAEEPANDPQTAGYNFQGWYENQQCTGDAYDFATPINDDITLYAKWTPCVYTITYKDQGNATFSGSHESGNPTQHTYGTATTLKGATKTGYTFGGWYKEAACTNKVTSLGATEYTANITLYAQWTANTYTVKFDGNGSDGGSMTDQSFTYGQSQALSANAFTRTNYSFKHWTINQDGTGTSYTDGQSVNNLTAENGATVALFAQWTPIYTITWLANGQEFHKQENAVEGTALDVPDSEPDASEYACDDKVFVGWTATPIDVSTDTEPADLFTTKNINVEAASTTYYAVFATVDGGGAPEETTLTIPYETLTADLTNSYSTQNFTYGGFTFEINACVQSNYCQMRDNATLSYIYIPELPGAITKIATSDCKNASGSSYTGTLHLKTTKTRGNSATDDIEAITYSSVNSFSWSLSNETYKTGYLFTSAGLRIKDLSITYTTSGGTSYSEYTTTCVKLPDPVISFVTTPADPIVFDPVNCGSTTTKAQAKTVQVSGANLQEYVSVEVTGPYKIARTSSTNLSDYSTSLTLDKTNTGTIHSDYQTVYIISCPPAQSTDATTGTLTFTTKKGNTLTVNLSTPTVNCTTYALTFNDRGNKTVENYYAGVQVPQPADPTGVCTDPIHYVFDGWAEATVANGSTEYTKVDFPYTMPGQNKTLYAVYRYLSTGGNGDYNLVTSALDDWSGDYLIAYDNKTFADGTVGGETGIGKLNNKVDLSSYISNNIIPATEGDKYNVTLEAVTGGYVLKTQDGKYNYHTNNDKNGISATTVIGTADNYPINVNFVSQEEINLCLTGDAAGSVLRYNTSGYFRFYKNGGQEPIYLYKKSSGTTLYTTSPICGAYVEITSDKDIYVTSGNAGGTRSTVVAQKTITFSATRLQPNAGGNAPSIKVPAADITVGGTPTTNVSLSITQDLTQQGDGTYAGTGEITVSYTPTAYNVTEDINVQLRAEYNTGSDVTLDAFTIHARSLPEEFVIVAKQGDKWYALNGDMDNGSSVNPANGQITLNDDANPTQATYAPCNTIYTFDGLPNTGDRTRVRFQGTDGAWLWAASGTNVGIQNKTLAQTPTGDNKPYNWKLETEDNITYKFHNDNSSRQLTLNGEKFGMYASGVQDIRILPYEAKCLYNYAPTNLKVSVLKATSVTLTWDAVPGATKYQYSSDLEDWIDAGTEPTVTINGLEGGTNQTYYIRAYHEDAGVSQECIDYAEITFTTANCDDVPTDITYTADLNSITVSWTAAAPTAIIKLYLDENGEHAIFTQSGTTSPWKISTLTKNTTYYLQIFANGTCASPIIPVKTEDIKVDVVEWQPQGIVVDINTNEKVGVTLENEVSYGSGAGSEATELFFSKYYEATTNVKLVAIYNGTKNIIDLNDYEIHYGKDSWENQYITLKDFGVTKGQIQPGEEIILYTMSDNDDSDKKIMACVNGDYPDGKWVRVTQTNNDGKGHLSFAGNKTLVLKKDGVVIDVIGALTSAGNPTSTKAKDTPSWGDAAGWNCATGLSIADDTQIGISTNRCLLIRNNTVTSGANAVTSNIDDFVTLCSEWKGAQVPDNNVDNGVAASCENFAYVGTFDYSDYYTQFETMGEEQTFDENARNEDGTVTVEIPDLYKQSCRNIRITLEDKDGNVLSNREYKVPIMITTTQGTDGQAFIDLRHNLATKIDDGNGGLIDQDLTYEEVLEICKTCDVVIRDNATLQKMADDAENDHPQVRDIYVYENSSLVVPNGTNYTINNLSLRRKEDAVASVSVYPEALKLPESAATPISLDFRMSAESWHWFTLPYDCNISEVTWIDGSPAQYNVDWFLMSYDGEKRAATQAGGCWKAFTGTTIKAGEGFIIAINGNINNPAHTYELRFPMSKEVLAAEGTDKTVDVRAWGVETNIRPNHKGWNLVGNPYLAYYQRNNITNFEGLRLGQLTGPDPQTGYWEQTGYVPYVVVPVGAGWIAYEQVLASETDLLPFTAYFVQVGNDGEHKSSDELSISFDHTKLQLSATPMPASIIQRATSETEVTEPVIVGVSLTNSLGESDKTSLVIDNQFTDEYEMNADFFKWFGDYYKYYTKPVVYSLGADNGKRAFNALSEDLATQPVSLGMYAAQAGNYTFTLDRRSDLSKVQEVWLYDATQDKYTNLMQDSYTFNTAKTESAGRFFLSVKMAPKVSTDINNVTDGTIWATTQDHTIFVNGLLSNAQLWIYDATGKLLHTDQTQYYQHTYQVPVSGTYFVRVQNTMQTQTIKVVVE